MTSTDPSRPSRAAFVGKALATGAGLALTGADVRPAQAAEAPQGACAASVREILATALVAEQLATTFYYAALSSPAVLRNSQLGGLSADPNNPGLPPNGNPHHVRVLQAALDAEAKHAALLIQAGAASPYKHFYFPPNTFKGLGTSVAPDSFLGVLERLEALSISMYVAATGQFLQLRRPDLASLATVIMGVEAEHRTLGRILAGVLPPNNLTLESAGFTCAGDAHVALNPFLTGRRYLFAPDATTATALPSRAHIARLVGKYSTRRLRRFL